MSGPVEVTQADRDAAASIASPGSELAEMRRDGRHDGLPVVQAFARHREAAVARYEAALTPSAKTKAAYIGEFQFRFGDFTPNVPWMTIKEIMAAIRAFAR